MIEYIKKGIVLEKISFEDEHIVKLLIDDGNLLSLKAKGLDKNSSKNRMSLNSFNFVEVEYFTSENSNFKTGRLKTARVIKEFINDSNLALNVFEVCRNLILFNERNNLNIYNSLTKIINLFELNNYQFQSILVLMILILRSNGYFPIIDRCVKCGTNKDIKAFSLYEGGLICKNHDESIKYELPVATLKKLIEINSLKNPLECNDLNFTPDEIIKIKSMYKLFLENQLAFNLYFLNKI